MSRDIKYKEFVNLIYDITSDTQLLSYKFQMKLADHLRLKLNSFGENNLPIAELFINNTFLRYLVLCLYVVKNSFITTTVMLGNILVRHLLINKDHISDELASDFNNRILKLKYLKLIEVLSY